MCKISSEKERRAREGQGAKKKDDKEEHEKDEGVAICAGREV